MSVGPIGCIFSTRQDTPPLREAPGYDQSREVPFADASALAPTSETDG